MAKILIVEDDPDVCETYVDILSAVGHLVEVVATSAEAIKRLPKFLPDVVILDLQLTGSSGTVVLSFIHRYSRLAHTKVIIASGHPEIARRAVADWGADLCLHKPISVSDLRAAVAAK